MHPNAIEHYRSETPACQQIIHLNNAGAALAPQLVTQTMLDYLRYEAANGGYEAAADHQAAIAEFYPVVAELVGARPEQIAFTTSATDSFNRALSSIPFLPGEVIVTTQNDYVSNQIAFLQLQQQRGVQVLRAADQASGGVDVMDVARLLEQHRPRLVAVTHVPSSSGLVQAVAAIGELCRSYGSLYLVDACQSVGQLPLDVQAIGCDFLSATFRKFLRGPRGAGFLYVSDKVLQGEFEPVFLDLHSAQWTGTNEYAPKQDGRRFELWERNYALVLGAKAAAAYAQAVGLENIMLRNAALAAQLREQLATLPGLSVLDQGEQLCSIVTCQVERADPHELQRQLRQQGVQTSAGSLEMARLDLSRKGVKSILRLSPHYYNTTTEIDQAVARLASLL